MANHIPDSANKIIIITVIIITLKCWEGNVPPTNDHKPIKLHVYEISPTEFADLNLLPAATRPQKLNPSVANVSAVDCTD